MADANMISKEKGGWNNKIISEINIEYNLTAYRQTNSICSSVESHMFLLQLG